MKNIFKRLMSELDPDHDPLKIVESQLPSQAVREMRSMGKLIISKKKVAPKSKK